MEPIVPLSIRPSFIRFMFYDECTPRLMFMGNAVWPLSAFNPFRSLFSPLFLFLLILSNSSKRISIPDILYPSYFSPPLFFLHLQLLPATPEGIIVNGGGGVSCSAASPIWRRRIEKLAGRLKTTWHTSLRVWLTILKSFPGIFPPLSGEIFSNIIILSSVCARNFAFCISICADF